LVFVDLHEGISQEWVNGCRPAARLAAMRSLKTATGDCIMVQRTKSEQHSPRFWDLLLNPH
jgi:exonuclease III